MNLRAPVCYVLKVLRVHNPDCAHCNASGCCGEDMRRRLEDLRQQDENRGDTVHMIDEIVNRNKRTETRQDDGKDAAAS